MSTLLNISLFCWHVGIPMLASAIVILGIGLVTWLFI